MKLQKGYTVVELIATVAALASIALVGFVLYIAVHFISKFW